jgi:phasin family protein
MTGDKGRQSKAKGNGKGRVLNALSETAAAPAQAVKSVQPAKPVAPAVLNPHATEAAELATFVAPEAPAVIAAPLPIIEPKPVLEAKPVVKQPAAEQVQQAPEPAPAPEPVAAAEPIVQPTVNHTNNIQAGAKTMTDTINNTVNQAREATQQAAEQIRTVVGQTSEQSKAAMEKSARFAEEIADLSRGNMEAMMASSKTAAKYVETLTQGAADYSRRSFEQASTAMRSFAEVKSPTDFFRLQGDFARSAFDQMVAESARVSETMVKMSGDVAEPITSRYSAAAERMKAMAA